MELFLDAFRKRKRSAFNLRKQTRTLGKEMRAFGCAALFAATGKDARIHITHTSDKRVVCVCVCVGTFPK